MGVIQQSWQWPWPINGLVKWCVLEAWRKGVKSILKADETPPSCIDTCTTSKHTYILGCLIQFICCFVSLSEDVWAWEWSTFNKYINTHTNTYKYSHLSPVKTQSVPEGQVDLSLCLKLLSPWQQAPHRFTLHHVGESESMQSWKEMKEGEWTRKDRAQEESDGETDGERNAGLNDKNKGRLKSNVEAEWGEMKRGGVL